MPKPNIRGGERTKRAAAGTAFLILILYLWLALEANKLTGFYRLILIIPLYLMALTFLESFFSYCVLKDRKSMLSLKIYLSALAIAALLSLVLIFI